MNALKLSYDVIPKMDLSLAKDYLERNASKIKPLPKEGYLRRGVVSVIDTELIFKNVINGIKANTDLIMQIEYMERGVLPECTKRELDTLLEYFQYYADIYPLFKTGELVRDIKNCTSNALFNRSLNISEDYFNCCVDFDDDFALSSLSFYVPTAIANETKIIFFRHSNTSMLMDLIEDILVDAGYLNFDIIDQTVDWFENDKLINFNSTFVVFEGSDLDSAVDSALNAAWSNIWSLWALKHICVQESVYKLFLAKLKERMLKFQWNLPSNYQARKCIRKVRDEIENLMSKANIDGIEHVEMHDSMYSNQLEYFKPLILLDNASWLAKYLEEEAETKNIPVLCVQAFRTTKEALSLVKQTSSQAVSLWCDSNSICNEFAISAPVSCIWINGFGHKTPNISFELKTETHRLCSGYAGLANIASSRLYWVHGSAKSKQLSNAQNLIEKVIKLRQTWIKYSAVEKANIFMKLFSHSEFISLFDASETSVRDCLKRVAQFCLKIKNENSVVGQLICTNVFHPLGIIAFRVNVTSNIINTIEVILKAVALGNGSIVCHSNLQLKKVINWLKINNIPVAFYPDGNDIITRVDGIFELFYDTDFVSEEFTKLLFCKRKTIWNSFGETFST